MKFNATTLLAAISVLLFIGIIAVSVSLFFSMKETENVIQEKQEMEELVALEKEEMRNDLALAQSEYQELIVKIDNDSLKFKLEREQMRTQALIEELERTKATNYAEITRLKKELKTLREVLKDYTRQIAELSRENENLKQETPKELNNVETQITGDTTYVYSYVKKAPNTAAIIYDLNGGVYNGSTANIIETHTIGEVISVHAAPTREGYTFQYWKGSEYQPGDRYTVTENHTFSGQGLQYSIKFHHHLPLLPSQHMVYSLI